MHRWKHKSTGTVEVTLTPRTVLVQSLRNAAFVDAKVTIGAGAKIKREK